MHFDTACVYLRSQIQVHNVLQGVVMFGDLGRSSSSWEGHVSRYGVSRVRVATIASLVSRSTTNHTILNVGTCGLTVNAYLEIVSLVEHRCCRGICLVCRYLGKNDRDTNATLGCCRKSLNTFAMSSSGRCAGTCLFDQ